MWKRWCGESRWNESREERIRSWWSKAYEWQPALDIRRAAKRGKSISNFTGKHPHKQHWTSKGDSFGCILHSRENNFALCFLLLPEMKTVWWIDFYLPWCLSLSLASAGSWLKPVGDKWQSDNHLMSLSWQQLYCCLILWRIGWTNIEFAFTGWMNKSRKYWCVLKLNGICNCISQFFSGLVFLQGEHHWQHRWWWCHLALWGPLYHPALLSSTSLL